jgi:hypothetical protein
MLNPQTLAAMLRHVRLLSACIAFGLILVPLVLSSAKADEPPAATSVLANTLTHEEFVRAGLQKLTPEELAALEAALIRHQQLPEPSTAAPVSTDTSSITYTHAPSSAPAGKVVSPGDKTAAFGAEQVIKAKPLETDAELHSHIEGTLDGFSGRAVFVLGNGQIWQQRVPETVYFAKKLVNPEVVLTRSFAGYKMLIVPADRVVFVKRIQ